MATRIAPALPTDRVTVIERYPASQAALARLCPNDDRLADRFELYVGDVELANGFVELTDAALQLERFEQDVDARARSGLKKVDIDGTLIAALENGLPPCAGVAVGLERLLMIELGVADIRHVVHFPMETKDVY